MMLTIMAEWICWSIPQWKAILQEALKDEDKIRAEYARWMLEEVLKLA